MRCHRNNWRINVWKLNYASVMGDCANGNLYSFKKYIQMLHNIRIAALKCVIAGPRRETTNSHSHQWTIQCCQVASCASLCTVGGGAEYLERTNTVTGSACMETYMEQGIGPATLLLWGNCANPCSHSVAVCFTISGPIHPFSTCSSYSQGHGGAAADSSRPWGEGGVKPPDGSAVIARPMLRW